ncbi:unnamed protein product [Gadus morhua 'NCC']
MSYTEYRKPFLPALRAPPSGSGLMKAPPSSSSRSALRVALPPLSSTPRMAWTQEVGGPRQPMKSLRPTVEGNQVDETTSHQKISRALIGRARNSFPDPPTRQLIFRQSYSEYDDKFRVPGGPFPPRVPRGSTLHPAHTRPGSATPSPRGRPCRPSTRPASRAEPACWPVRRTGS